jgi:hypothetical protein
MEIKLILAVEELTSQRKYRKGKQRNQIANIQNELIFTTIDGFAGLTLEILSAFGENDVLFLSCYDAVRKTSCSTQSVANLAFYIISCLPQ